MAVKRNCEHCGEELEDPPCLHIQSHCEWNERLKGREEIKKLKVSVRAWQDAWFQLRDIIGNLHWHHKAIDSDAERTYYQNNLKQLADKKQTI